MDAAVGLRDLEDCTLQGHITMSLINRLKSADLSLLAKKLQEKECPDLPIFIEDDGLLADALVNRTMEHHGLDAERAFAHTLPVGTTTPTGVNPGNLYKAFRERENPAHAAREAGLIFGQANKIAESLTRSSSDLLRETASRATRCRDMDPRIKRQRQNTLQMAWDYPRAIVSLSANLQAARVQHDIEYLRTARFFLLRADLAWPSFVRRMHDTPEHPVDA